MDVVCGNSCASQRTYHRPDSPQENARPLSAKLVLSAFINTAASSAEISRCDAGNKLTVSRSAWKCAGSANIHPAAPVSIESPCADIAPMASLTPNAVNRGIGHSSTICARPCARSISNAGKQGGTESANQSGETSSEGRNTSNFIAGETLKVVYHPPTAFPWLSTFCNPFRYSSACATRVQSARIITFRLFLWPLCWGSRSALPR